MILRLNFAKLIFKGLRGDIYLHKSYPAALVDPFVGAIALLVNFTNLSLIWCEFRLGMLLFFGCSKTSKSFLILDEKMRRPLSTVADRSLNFFGAKILEGKPRKEAPQRHGTEYSQITLRTRAVLQIMPLVLLCGFPCSGKSQRAHELSSFFTEKGITATIISDERPNFRTEVFKGKSKRTLTCRR